MRIVLFSDYLSNNNREVWLSKQIIIYRSLIHTSQYMLAIQLIRIRGLDLGYIGLQDTGTGNRKQGYRIQNTGHRIHETGHRIQGY